METVLDPGHDDQTAREDAGQHLYDLLALFAFGAWPALEPAFDKTGIAIEERQGAEERGNREQHPVHLLLPKTLQPRGQEEQQRHNDLEPDKGQVGLLAEIVHVHVSRNKSSSHEASKPLWKRSYSGAILLGWS